jgi:enoyl-CoA hydratase/carnithine racemase
MELGLNAFYTMADMEFTKAVMYLREMVVLLLSTEDSQEGVTAFLEKRKPKWKGK